MMRPSAHTACCRSARLPDVSATEHRTEADDERNWGVDAAIGAAAVVARVTGGIASTVGSSPPAKAIEGVARWMVRPLSREGAAVRERVVRDGVPAAQDAVKRVTPAVLDAVDLDSVLSAIDVDALVSRVDVGGLIDQVDVDGIVGQVDVDGIIGRVDIDELLKRIDIGALLERIDLNQLLSRIDLNELLNSVDLNVLLVGVDLDALLAGLDLNAVVERLDVDGLIANTEMGAIIVRSTGGAASEVLDSVRSQGVSIDSVVSRMASRLLRRDVDELPSGPELLVHRPLALTSGGGGDEEEKVSDRGPGSEHVDASSPGSTDR